MIAQASSRPEDLQHGTPGQLEGYVMGLLEPREQRWLEAHVSGCLLCARALATEARREMALAAAISTGIATSMTTSMTTTTATGSGRGPAPRVRRYHGPLLAMAAALALVASLGRQRAGIDPFAVMPGVASEQAAGPAPSPCWPACSMGRRPCAQRRPGAPPPPASATPPSEPVARTRRSPPWRRRPGPAGCAGPATGPAPCRAGATDPRPAAGPLRRPSGCCGRAAPPPRSAPSDFPPPSGA
jgi:hypothetical protein